MEKTYILGISAFYHDSAAALLCNGVVIAAAQEERFTRKKADSSFPINAINFCLKYAEIEVSDISHVVFYDKPILKFDRILASYLHTAPLGIRSFIKAIPLWLREKLWTEDKIKKDLNYDNDILFTQHHQSHAASAFYPSPFNEAAVLTVDGAGEWTTTAISYGDGNKLNLLQTLDFPHSLGLLYSAFTYYCGFKVNSGEYKLMGLAPYGTPIYKQKISDNLVSINADGSISLNLKFFDYISGLKMINRNFIKLFGMPARRAEEPLTQFYMDIAASIQEVTNDIIVAMARQAKKLTNSKNLCLAGGVTLNCCANHVLAKSGIFENIFVQPAAGDAGGALGAALYVHYALLDNPRIPQSHDQVLQLSGLGPDFTADEIEALLIRHGLTYKKMNEQQMYAYCANALNDQKIIGWFQGRMEFGPRALGQRSIIGDPRNADMQKKMNLKIKFRESFRPFAPAVTEDAADEYFDIPDSSKLLTRYMLTTATVAKKHLKNTVAVDTVQNKFSLLETDRSTINAVTHVDGSARVQVVREKDNPKFYKLLKAFELVSGLPMLINTSFNVRGEPIVCTPEDALYCFFASNIDILVLECFILEKQSQSVKMDLTEWKKKIIQD
ncbi:MAG: carbamoyltransferase N-terminal domain-containing protein [Spirochaetota bacterium]|nr:carbamoyltransferase N-terminal domain-containing protein [Spirochaetota bacterium]